MIQYQIAINDFLESLDPDILLIDADTDEDVFIEIDDQCSIVFHYDHQYLQIVLRAYLSDAQENSFALKQLESQVAQTKIDDKVLSFGTEQALNAAYVELILSDEDFDPDRMKMFFQNLIEVCSWFKQIGAGSAVSESKHQNQDPLNQADFVYF